MLHLESDPVFGAAPSPILLTSVTQVTGLSLSRADTDTPYTTAPIVDQTLTTTLRPTWFTWVTSWSFLSDIMVITWRCHGDFRVL